MRLSSVKARLALLAKRPYAFEPVLGDHRAVVGFDLDGEARAQIHVEPAPYRDLGVIVGSFLYAVFTRSFRIEWFASRGDFANHAAGGVLMGTGGVLSMGCTVGQAITGMSTLALGSILTFAAIVAGAVAAMKFQYWRLMREG